MFMIDMHCSIEFSLRTSLIVEEAVQATGPTSDASASGRQEGLPVRVTRQGTRHQNRHHDRRNPEVDASKPWFFEGK